VARGTGTRITGGSLRGELVRVLPGRAVRPMRSRVREALFAILGHELEGARVLDLFAGSGALGAEAISRGATRVIFVERDPRVLRVLEENRRSLGILPQTEVAAVDLHRTSPSVAPRCTLAICDPPFPTFRESGSEKDPWRVLERVARDCLEPGARVVMEHPRRTVAPLDTGIAWEESRRYGETELRLGRVLER
jgi:16S rRNA (guanine966-N2)-methyltransferase